MFELEEGRRYWIQTASEQITDAEYLGAGILCHRDAWHFRASCGVFAVLVDSVCAIGNFRDGQ